MKKILGAVVFLAAIAVVASFVTDGGLPFLQGASEEEQAINELRSELRDAQRTYRQAGRAAGLSGVDTTADAAAALREVDRIERELAELKRTVTGEEAKTALRNLEAEIQDVRRELR